MKLLFFCYLLVLFAGYSCGPASDHGQKDELPATNTDHIQHKPPGSFSDTVLIDVPAAVFYNPDSLQLEKIRVITDTAIFESMVHDCFYQMRNARIQLKQYYPEIRIIEVKNARYLDFRKKGGGQEIIDLDTKDDPCGLFIFDTRESPRLTDMTNINSELGFYFNKRSG